jgi:uncharacterized protein YlxW (UPF0749 family)
MSLLVDIAQQALDPAYADVAARRRSDPSAPVEHSPTRGALAMGGVLGATLLLVLAAVQTHRHAPSAERSRQSLVAQVQRETASVTRLQRSLDTLRDRTQQLRDRVLQSSTTGSALAARVDAADLAAGTLAATGPGLKVVVDDAADSTGGNQVLDRDLQSLVNALWAAGAEAVAIDNQRITAQTAIRQAGSQILVNLAPVARPYVIVAIGDPVALATSFGSSDAVSRMRTYSQLYGLRFHFTRASSLIAPSAPGLTLRYAVPVPARHAAKGETAP